MKIAKVVKKADEWWLDEDKFLQICDNKSYLHKRVMRLFLKIKQEHKHVTLTRINFKSANNTSD